jgi:hypothetical protein
LARLHDISASGVSLLVRRRFEPKTLLVVELTTVDPALPRTLLVRVVNVRPAKRREWLLGCALVQGLSEDELRLMV